MSTINITRKRGDTYDEIFTIKQDNLAVNIAGFSFLLTVNIKQAPRDAATEIFQSVGAILVSTDGTVKFPISLADSDQVPKTYFFDVQMTDTSGKITTVAEGKWIITQDITK